MPSMTKKPDKKKPSGENTGKRPPSRENTSYVALPKDLYKVLKRYADDHSDEDSKKSASWAARKAVRKFLTEEGYWPPPSNPKSE